jgi:hypothetical protein
MNCIPQQILFRLKFKKNEVGGTCGTHALTQKGINLREIYHLEDLDVDWLVILQLILRKAWTECVRLMTGTSGGLLCERQWTRFHRIRGISWPAEELVASQAGLCSMELVRSPLFEMYY